MTKVAEKMPQSEGGGDASKMVSKGTVLEEFKEVEEVHTIIKNLANIYRDQIAVEMALERFLVIIDQYQEQPHLMDPHLEPLLAQLLDVARNPEAPEEVVHLAFRLLYLLTKTRGSKVIIRLLPHEVADVEPVLRMAERQNPSDYQTWETRYMLLLWLSVVCMIPFDMVRLDSSAKTDSGETKKPVMSRITEIGMKYLAVSDKSRDAAAFMLSRFMTRPDVKREKLPEFLDWTLVNIKQANCQNLAGVSAMLGILSTLALLFKHGKREDLMPYAATVLEHLQALNLKESSNTVLRKLSSKLTQRLGLTFLKARVAAWRYQRGNRSLTDNLARKTTMTGGTGDAPEDEEYDIPDEIEEVIEQLLISLRDKDTIVRWSAAKGIGRVTGRLPKELADEVVASIMELFTITETDGAWHGGCLALAELGRRGLLLPQRLPDVVPVIIKALNFEEKRGNFSVGSHVRDAACYVCWAFARAYDPQEMALHVKQIATALVIVFLFDREVNVRRAAAAAFQENVGRQGQFPHGIDILTTCDYFAVGNRIVCYQELSVFVADFPEYTQALIDHLGEVKISHWDSAMRELAAKGLHQLTPKSPEYVARTVLPELVRKCTTMDVYLRHGALLATAEVCHALAKLAWQSNKEVTEFVPEEELKNIVRKLHESKLFRGVGGELMREAMCCMIDRLSLSKMPFHGDPILEIWQELIDDCLQHLEPNIQAAAIKCIPSFFAEYYRKPDGSAKSDMQGKILGKYISQLQSTVETTRCGYALALGTLPQFMLVGKLEPVLEGLTTASKITQKDHKMAQARRDAIKALTGVCISARVDKSGLADRVLCAKSIDVVYKTLFEAMKDYTLDSRGDVGACVREASMSGLSDVTSMLANSEPSLITPDVSRQVFCSLVQQACEKIDRTRAHAGNIFAKLLYHSPEVPHIPHRQELCTIFKESEVENIHFAVPSATFPLFAQLLMLPTYRYHILLGLTVSVGGLTESLVKHSSIWLMKYLRAIAKDLTELQAFSDTLLQVFKDFHKVDRVSLPMLKMLDQLLANDIFSLFAEDGATFPEALLMVSKQEISKCGDVQKLLASTDVFCGMLQFTGSIRKKSLSQLLLLLGHSYPIVRRSSANKLYSCMVIYDDLVGAEQLEKVMALLSETQWDQPLKDVRLVRNELCDLLGLPRFVSKKPPQQESSSKKAS